MKRIMINASKYLVLFFLLSVLLFLVVLDVKAQGPVLNRAEVIADRIYDYGPVGVDGSVMIRGLELEEVGDSLLLAFNVEVDRRAINNRQSWRFVPELSVPETGQSAQFPTLLITGRQKERHFQRKERFGNRWLMENYPDYKTSMPKGTDTVITYRVTVPYEDWMDKAHLTVHQYLASPKEKRQLFSYGGHAMMRPEPKAPYHIQPLVNYITPPKEVKRRSAAYRALIDFPMGLSRIIADYRRNPEELALIDRQLRLIKDNPYVEIGGIYMEGYASPDGRNENNRRLSEERAKALENYFVEHHGVTKDILHITNVTEDWDGMRTIVDGWEDAASKQRVLKVIDCPDAPDTKEKRLRVLPEWVRLVKEVFPLLRRTEYRIHFIIRDFSVEETRSLIETHPELFSHYELYMLAMSYGDNTVRRLEILEMILRYYPEDDIALNNYGAALISSGELASAKRYLGRISDKSVAANNFGIIHLLAGEWDDAECYLKLSRTEESLHNLQELRRKIEDDKKTGGSKNR